MVDFANPDAKVQGPRHGDGIDSEVAIRIGNEPECERLSRNERKQQKRPMNPRRRWIDRAVACSRTSGDWRIRYLTPKPQSLKEVNQFCEAIYLKKVLSAGRGRKGRMFKNPCIFMVKKDRMEAGGEGWVYIALGTVANHPGGVGGVRLRARTAR